MRAFVEDLGFFISAINDPHETPCYHRPDVIIAGANFPRFGRNPNMGHPLFSDAECQTATQTIFHDVAHPSHIVLPVIPR
jgi:predicted acyl esterase